MATPENAVIGVVGAGTMGRGVIQLFAQAGHTVYFYDSWDGAAEEAREFVVRMVQRGVDKGRLAQEEADATTRRLNVCETIDQLSTCNVVIEAILENIEIKREMFATLEDVVVESAILASNTSSLLVSSIAAGCRHPERVAGLHFFNPVPLMKVAEVISAVRTAPETVDFLSELVDGTGHRAVVAADQPGFLVNHAGRGLYTEGLRILEEKVASHNEVDQVLREAAGFRMGPFELLDLTGLDVSGKVMDSIYEQFQHEPRFRPSSLIAPRIAAGLFGRKSGAGWYRYENSNKVEPEKTGDAALAPGTTVWIDPEADQAGELKGLAKSAGAGICERDDGKAVLLIQPWGIDASEACARMGLDATRTVAIDPLPGLDKHRTLMLTPVTTPSARDNARAILVSDGGTVTTINDSAGFILQRVLVTIINIAANIAQRGIAGIEDIEDAVRLGLGYPHGPLTWGDKIGSGRVLQILEQIQSCTGDTRYRPSQWLRRRARLGLSLLTPESER